MLTHILDFSRCRLPVSAESISAVGIISLPAIIHNYSTKTKFLCSLAFCFNFLIRKLLMIGIPEGIHRFSCRLRNRCRVQTTICFPPNSNFPDCLFIANIPVIAKQRKLVVVAVQCPQGNHYHAIHGAVFFVNTKAHSNLLKCFRKCKGSTILSLFVKEADHRCRYGTHRFFSIAPICFDAAVKSAVRMPSSSDVQNWKAPLQNKLCILCMLCLCQADYLHTSSIFQLLCTMYYVCFCAVCHFHFLFPAF